MIRILDYRYVKEEDYFGQFDGYAIHQVKLDLQTSDLQHLENCLLLKKLNESNNRIILHLDFFNYRENSIDQVWLFFCSVLKFIFSARVVNVIVTGLPESICTMLYSHWFKEGSEEVDMNLLFYFMHTESSSRTDNGIVYYQPYVIFGKSVEICDKVNARIQHSEGIVRPDLSEDLSDLNAEGLDRLFAFFSNGTLLEFDTIIQIESEIEAPFGTTTPFELFTISCLNKSIYEGD